MYVRRCLLDFGYAIAVVNVYLNAKVSQPFNICIFSSMVLVRILI